MLTFGWFIVMVVLCAQVGAAVFGVFEDGRDAPYRVGKAVLAGSLIIAARAVWAMPL